MDRDRRRFEDNNDRRYVGGDNFEPRFDIQRQSENGDMQFMGQGFIPPQPTPIRRSNYQNDQQYINNTLPSFQQGNNQPLPQQPAYPGQPTQFTIPYPQNQNPFGPQPTEEFTYDYNQNYQRQGQMQQEMGKKKKGFFSFMNKKEEQETPQTMSNVVIVYPKSVTEVSNVIDRLRKGQAIIVDLTKVNEKFVQRTMDYLSGAIYALCGAQQRIADSMFLFTPYGVSIQGPTDLKNRYDD